MNDTISVWGVAIPSLLSTALGGLVAYYVTHQLTKDIEAIKSRLHREEEAFRLAHSPRVTAAVKLWAAFCEFERAAGAAVSPFSIAYEPTTGTREQKDAAMKEQHRADVAAKQKRVGAAWEVLKLARDEAECLIDGPTFEKFSELFSEVDSAFGQVWGARIADDHKMLAMATMEAMTKLGEAKVQRAEVVAAMRRAIAGEG